MEPSNHRSFSVNAFQIASIIECPLENFRVYWPFVLRALEREGLADRHTIVAAIATIAIEEPEFKPLDEPGESTQFLQLYEYRKDLGNYYPGDGAKYHGRGFFKLRGRSNYRIIGNLVGVDLISDPDKALRPEIAAQILAVHFRLKGVHIAAAAGDWRRVRVQVSGDFTHMVRFLYLVHRLNTCI